MENATRIKTLFHDIRARLGVLQVAFEDPEHFFKDKENVPIIDAMKQAFKDVTRDLEGLRGLFNELSVGADKNHEQGVVTGQYISPKIVTDEKSQVLVIDDDHEIRSYFEKEFTERGRFVLSLEKGEDLLSQKIDFKKIGTAIVDYQFDDSALDGLDIAEYLKLQKVRHIHLCTGCFDDSAVVKRAREIGIVSIIAKPVPQNVWESLV